MKTFILFITLTLLFPLMNYANEDRWIDIEFDAIENALSYEIELSQKIEQQKMVLDIYKSETPTWNKKVKPGNYFVRIRSIDKRNAPGPWSDEIFIPIKLSEVKILYPLKEAIIDTDENEQSHKINFEWLPTSGANFYRLLVYNDKKIVIYDETSELTNQSVYLTNRGRYLYEVIPLVSKEDEISKNLNLNTFELTYGKLPAPKPKLSTTESSLIISWDESIEKAKYYLKILKISENQEEKLLTEKILNNAELILNKKQFTEGTYKLTLYAQKEGYQNSTTSQIVYEYEKNEIKIVIEKFTGIFDEEKRKVLNHTLWGFLSYPSLNYEFQNFENDTFSQQKLSGESYEFGHMIKTNLSLLNSPVSLNSTLRIMNLADNYASALFIRAEALALLEKRFNEKILLLPAFGIFINKTPALVINRLDPSTAKEESFLNSGLTSGLKSEYRYNEQMIFKAHYHLRANLIPISSLPENKQKLSFDHELSFQAGYAFRTHLNLVLKGTYLNETILSTPKTSSGSFANSSDENKITNSGFLMSFGGEWFF